MSHGQQDLLLGSQLSKLSAYLQCTASTQAKQSDPAPPTPQTQLPEGHLDTVTYQRQQQSGDFPLHLTV